MKRIALSIAAITALIGTSVAASAQSTEGQSTNDILRRLQAIEANNAALAKENAALRERIKVSEENAKLRDRVSQLKGSDQTAVTQQNSATSASPSKRTDPKLALYDKASSPMVVKEPPPAPAPVPYSWTGWYGGFNVGGTWSNDAINLNTTNVQFCSVAQGCINALNGALASAAGTTGVFSGNTNGFIGGGQFGYNWQFANWVAGFETDIQGVGDGKNHVVGGTVPSVLAVSFTTSMTLAKEIDYLGTVRGRLGWLATPSLLVYGNGGLAYGEVKASTTINQTFNGLVPGVVVTPSSFSSISQTRTGWTAVAVSSGCLRSTGQLRQSTSTMILAA